MHFTEHLVGDGFNYAYGISLGDMDGDGDLDIVAADTNVGLYWFENDGRGNFTRHVIHRQADEWLERHAWGDVDGDGRPELVFVDNLGGSVLYFDCQGDPRDAAAWRRVYISTPGSLPGAYDVAVADFDGDGDLDVAASSWVKGNRFVWYENRQGEWVEHLIEDNIGETRTVVAVDMNGDGRVDLLGTASAANEVMWYENPGDPRTQPWKKHLIARHQRPIHAHPVDMDGDGDWDIVLASGLEAATDADNPGEHAVVWYENLGGPGEDRWHKHIISDDLPFGFEAVAADLDGDGQMEVVATSWWPDGMLALYKHRGDPRGPWDRQILRAPWVHADTVLVVDLDRDGRLDLVAAAERGSNEVRWWRNLGGEHA